MRKTIGLAIATVFILASALMAQYPTRNQFQTTVLMTNLANPTNMTFLPNGKIYVLSKNGVIRLHDPVAGTTTTAATLAVSNVREDGLHSLVLDPNFATNRRVYVLFGVTTPSQAIVVARYTALASDNLDLTTRVNVISIPYTITNGDEHNTGCLAFDPSGNLYIGLADNTNNFFSGPTTGYSPRDPARPNFDAQRSAANSNDLRGKILRIHPEDNGTYTIPAGNLFPVGTALTRPEIYVMGVRHPFRISVDAGTGWLYWSEPGPNANTDDPNQGPRGYDVIQIAKTAGNAGWPYCRGNNFCYTIYNYSNNTSSGTYNPNALVNTSANNTGIQNLPASRPALVWYPYNSSGTAFPVFGTGNANTAMSGPVYRFNGALASTTKLPAVYDNHLFIWDWSRSLVHVVQLSATGTVLGVLRFWDPTGSPGTAAISNPMDVKIGPDGALYFLNWVGTGYTNNGNAGTLIRLDYTGPQTPISQAKKSKRPVGIVLQAFGLGQEILFPEGSTGVEAFDLQGNRVWNHRRSGSELALRLQASSVLTGVMHLRFRFD